MPRSYQICLKPWHYGSNDFQDTSPYSSVGTGYGMDDRGPITGVGKRCSLFYSDQFASGAHMASYPKGKDVPFLEVNRSGREAAKSSPSNAKAKNGRSLPPFPVCLHDEVCNWLSRETILSFSFCSWNIKPIFCRFCFVALYLQWGTKKDTCISGSTREFFYPD